MKCSPRSFLRKIVLRFAVFDRLFEGNPVGSASNIRVATSTVQSATCESNAKRPDVSYYKPELWISSSTSGLSAVIL